MLLCQASNAVFELNCRIDLTSRGNRKVAARAHPNTMKDVVPASPLVSRQLLSRWFTGQVVPFSAVTSAASTLCILLPREATRQKLIPSPRRPLVLRKPLQYHRCRHSGPYLEKNRSLPPSSQPTKNSRTASTIREDIYTIPNALTISRILACPVLGWAIVKGDFVLATSLLAYAGVTDWVDGFVARRYNMKSVLGTILDPAADKVLMTTLTVTLTVKGLLPFPLAVIILGRDVLLSLSAFYIRYKSLPAPKTFARYWDFSIPSAEVHPTAISKINTALQLLLMTCATVSPLLRFDVHVPLLAFQWIVAGTTIWSGVGYLFSRGAVRYVGRSSITMKPK